MLALERYDKAEPINVGTGREITIKALVELIAKLTGYSGKIIWDASRPDGQPRRMLETSRAAEEFGFQATTVLEDGLERTITWYREHSTSGSHPPGQRERERGNSSGHEGA